MEINCDSNRLFDSKGNPIQVTEQDGDTAIYTQDGSEQIGTIGQDIFTIRQLTDLTAVLKALKVAEGKTRHHPKYSVTVGKRVFVVFNGRLAARIYKQRGRVPHYAAISIEEALQLANPRYQIRYIKGTDRFFIKDRLAKNW